MWGKSCRRCLRCSSGHCCNSWCKEEYVLASVFIATSLTQLLLYLPLIGSLIRDSFGPENGDWPPPFVTTKLGSTPLSLEVLTFPETARALEMAVAGLTLPIACYLTLPTYRQFCSEPDPDDLKNSTPKCKCYISSMLLLLMSATMLHYILKYITTELRSTSPPPRHEEASTILILASKVPS